jgi:hypothetical protein
MLLFHEEKILEARVRLTSHNILEIANPSRIHSHSRKEAAFHALVRNTSCSGHLTRQVIARVSGDRPSGDLR